MADHTAPDYYEQVIKEANEAIAKQNKKIEEEVIKLIKSHFYSLQREIGKEFGMASVRGADFSYIEDILFSLAHSAADKAKGVMIDAHYRQTRESLDATLNAVMTGIKIGKEKYLT